MSRYRANFSQHRNNRPRRSKRRLIKAFDPTVLVNTRESTPTDTITYQPRHHFRDFQITDILKKNIFTKGFTHPTPIQDQAIPVLLAKRDIIGSADTGTGKTGAFLIPLIHQVYQKTNETVLIMAPTRELAEQIDKELSEFSRGMKIYSCLCIGGVPIQKQIAQLRRNPHFIIGTPGRLKDIENRRIVNFKSITSLVLDEVDANSKAHHIFLRHHIRSCQKAHQRIFE